MPRIADYTSLCQAIQDFSHRPSINQYADYFVQGGENRIYRRLLALNAGNGLEWMEQTLTGTIDATAGTMAIPSDYFSLENANVVTSQGTYELVAKEPGWIFSRYPARVASGIPAYIARQGSNFIFGPFPDDAYSITGTYYGRGAPLTTSNPTTWMTTNITDTLLAACMIEVSKFLKDGEAEQEWKATLDERLTDICIADKASRYSGGTLVMDTGDNPLL